MVFNVFKSEMFWLPLIKGTESHADFASRLKILDPK